MATGDRRAVVDLYARYERPLLSHTNEVAPIIHGVIEAAG